ncbi:MAG: DNA replication/repair protein RecF [Pseudomonadota bacterium]
MWLTSLQAQNLRCFEKIELKLSPDINFFIGDNGAGKTSILEAVDTLSRGKSFRANHLRTIANYDNPEMSIFAEVDDGSKHSVQLGIQFRQNRTELRINREKVKKWSELAVCLPVIDIHPESYLLITGGPVERRKFLAWGTFHVEPSFLPLWTEYYRALRQRNACLREQKPDQARHWHPILAANGEKINSLFRKYSEQLSPYVTDLLRDFELPQEIELCYSSGFNDQSLFDGLDKELKRHPKPMVTSCGPHRSDIKIYWNDHEFAKTSSRGQQKVLALVLKLAQAKLLSNVSNKPSIYLIDELPAELDEKRCFSALSILKSLKCQAFITSVSTERIESFTTAHSNTFHVEQGQVREML